MNGATVSAPVLFRIDETCAFNADPYPSCDVATYGAGSRPALDIADYNTNLGGGGALTDQQKLPNAVLANVRDVIGRESLTGASGSVLNTQFFPTTGTAGAVGYCNRHPACGSRHRQLDCGDRRFQQGGHAQDTQLEWSPGLHRRRAPVPSEHGDQRVDALRSHDRW